MKIAVYGLGKMGRATIYALEELGYEVIGIDVYPSMINLSEEQKKRFGHNYKLVRGQNKDLNIGGIVSCLPYYLNEEIAEKYIDNNIPYFDLGGNLKISKYINNYASIKNATVFTDLGLAPGLVNILGENLIGPQDNFLEMYCGGLPQKKTNPLGYSSTWSIDGLLNEYRDDCLVKEGGIVKEAYGMEGYKIIRIKNKTYEAFYTSGALNYNMPDIENVSYRTVRYIGHRELMRWLMKNLDEPSIISLLQNGCPPEEDKIVIKLVTNSRKTAWEIFPTKGFSAMQVATGFSLACTVHQVLKKNLSGQLKYKDICSEELIKDLESLGVEL